MILKVKSLLGAVVGQSSIQELLLLIQSDFRFPTMRGATEPRSLARVFLIALSERVLLSPGRTRMKSQNRFRPNLYLFRNTSGSLNAGKGGADLPEDRR
jgi:hypothetical protein